MVSTCTYTNILLKHESVCTSLNYHLAQHQQYSNSIRVLSRLLITYEIHHSTSPALSLSRASSYTMFSGSLPSILRVERGVCTPESSSKAPPSDRCPTSGRLSAAKSSLSIVLGSLSPQRCCNRSRQQLSLFSHHVHATYQIPKDDTHE
jgi:hypothetical protein